MSLNHEKYLAKDKKRRRRMVAAKKNHRKKYTTKREANARLQLEGVYHEPKKIKARVSGQVGYTGESDPLYDEAMG